MNQTSRAIRAVIFDYGGVLMRTESHVSREQLGKRFGLTVLELSRLVFESEESQLVQLGRMAPDERWERIGRQLGLQTREEALAVRREMFAGDELDQQLVAYIRDLRRRVKTALLSNATVRLVSTLRDELHIEDCFDTVVISAQVGLMKPDPAIYRLVLDRLGVTPQHAVFIDDMPENVSAAVALGMHGIRFTTRQALLQELEPLLQAPEA